MSDWSPDIALLCAFDDAEWLAVERNYCGRLAAYVTRRVADREARDDILQETFLGAVRGIGGFDPVYSFEQYLFGICKNRTIDHLRRVHHATFQSQDGADAAAPIDSWACEEDTPSRIVRREDLARAGRALLVDLLRDWVQETWEQGEFGRLMVVEALFSAGWRNRDTWERFELRDETSVAGIKFRALKRLRELALRRDPGGELSAALATALASEDESLAIDVRAIWRAGRVSCPARQWLARLSANSLPAGPAEYVRFHLEEMKCEWCQANQDDLCASENEAERGVLLERVGASTLHYLRSRTLPS